MSVQRACHERGAKEMSHHTVQFKISAVLEAQHASRPLNAQSMDLGITPKTFWKWRQDERFEIKSIAEVEDLRTEIGRLRQQVTLLQEAWHVDRNSKKAIYAYMSQRGHVYPIELMCQVFHVSKSGYYAWIGRPPSNHEEEDVELKIEIERIFEASRATYGSPRIHAELIELGHITSRKRVARLMKELGLRASMPRRFIKTTLSAHDGRIAPNLLEQNFSVSEMNQVWVTDITYIATDEGWLYLSMFLDLFSRRVVGWSADSHMRDELVLDSLYEAFSIRGAELDTRSLTIHSDRGSQYASKAFIESLEARGITRSMSSTGCCFDNAVAESFFASLKKELIYRMNFRTRDEAVAAITEYIERFYNVARRHSANAYFSPRTREMM
jgi:transposase InsO family protein